MKIKIFLFVFLGIFKIISSAKLLVKYKESLSNENLVDSSLKMQYEKFEVSNNQNQTAQINTTNNPVTAALASALSATSTPATSNATASATNSTDSGAAAGTNVFNGQSNSSDALGFVGPTNYSISAPPYSVKDCNQVLLVDVQRITDMKDYCKKEQGFFTMSIYMANIFQAKDSNKLVDSLNMDKIVKVPYDLPGAPNCLNFEGKTKSIAICVQSPDIVFQLKQAYEEFLRCRKGLKPLTPEDILRLMKECENLKKLMSATKTDPKKDNGRSISELEKDTRPLVVPTGMEINPYYSSLRVPGS